MSFYYPLGLLGLIGIPILIIIYILKSQYAEQTVPSLYIWELSEKFLKKKKRLNLFGGIFGLIMQILVITAISFSVARPVFVLANAANDYVFVLDASGSMQTQVDGSTRFELGKEEIAKIIDESKKGSTYSLIVAAETPSVIYEKISDKTDATQNLKNIQSNWISVNCADAISVAQNYYTSDHSPITYLVTDKDYNSQNINVINMSNGEENYAFVSYGYHKNVTSVTVEGKVISYIADGTLDIELRADGEAIAQVSVEVEHLVETDFTVTGTVASFSQLEVAILNSDALPEDNLGVMYTIDANQNNRALLVSDYPAYLQFALRASGKTAVETISTKTYAEHRNEYTNYGLYVFDTFSDLSRLPQQLPQNAAVWFFNLQASIPKTGFSFRSVNEAEGIKYFEPTYTTATDSFSRTIVKDITRQTLAVKKYAKYALNRNFTTVMSNDGDGLVFIGLNENGNRQVVFSFDLHDSDYAMNPDFLVLTSNLLSYSFPEVIDQTLYTAGDVMTVNVPQSCTDLVLTSPSGKISYPDFSTAYSEVALPEVGTYNLCATVSGTQQNYSLYVRLPVEESIDTDILDISVTQLADDSSSDGYYDDLWAFLIVLAVVFLLDWGVYCYEQYQLR